MESKFEPEAVTRALILGYTGPYAVSNIPLTIRASLIVALAT